jgi:transposase
MAKFKDKRLNKFETAKMRDEALTMIISGMTRSAVAKHFDRSIWTINQWARSPQWKKREDEFSQGAQAAFKLSVDNSQEEFFQGALDVARSRDDRTANARSNIFKSMMEYTKMIDRHPPQVINNNTLISMKLLNENELSKLSMEEKVKMLTSGIIPEKLKVVNE